MTINECRSSRAKKIYARAIKDYEVAWMSYTIPEGTIVRLEMFNFPVLYLDNEKYVLIHKSH